MSPEVAEKKLRKHMSTTRKNALMPSTTMSHMVHWRHHRKHSTKKNSLTLKEWVAINKAFWDIVAEELVNRPGGVMLRGLGYFAHWLSPIKVVPSQSTVEGREDYLNLEVGSQFYHTDFFPEVVLNSPLRRWSYCRTVNYRVKMGRWRKILSGMKYRLYYSMLKRNYRIHNLKDIEHDD